MLYTNKDLVKLIIPLIIEQVLIMLVGMVDVMMISGVGEAAVSGVSLVDTVNVLIYGTGYRRSSRGRSFPWTEKQGKSL